MNRHFISYIVSMLSSHNVHLSVFYPMFFATFYNFSIKIRSHSTIHSDVVGRKKKSIKPSRESVRLLARRGDSKSCQHKIPAAQQELRERYAATTARRRRIYNCLHNKVHAPPPNNSPDYISSPLSQIETWCIICRTHNIIPTRENFNSAWRRGRKNNRNKLRLFSLRYTRATQSNKFAQLAESDCAGVG